MNADDESQLHERIEELRVAVSHLSLAAMRTSNTCLRIVTTLQSMQLVGDASPEALADLRKSALAAFQSAEDALRAAKIDAG